MIRQIETTNAALPTASYSQAMVHGALIATGGQVGIDPATGKLEEGLEAQVSRAIKNLEQVLIAAGSDLSHVLKTNCFLTNIADFADFDRVYAEHFAEPFPARSTIGIELAGSLLFEIEAWAVVDQEHP